jgi:hypothetical protein
LSVLGDDQPRRFSSTFGKFLQQIFKTPPHDCRVNRRQNAAQAPYACRKSA